MTKSLEQRLQEELDGGELSAELRAELEGQPELLGMIDVDAALREMPSPEFDLSESVLRRLDEDLPEIEGLFDPPAFDVDRGPVEDAAAAPEPSTEPSKPISLDDARRTRSAAPFLLAAAAVVGLVGTGTLMTLNSPANESMYADSAAVVGGLPEAEYAEEMPAEVAAAPTAAPEPSLAAPSTPSDHSAFAGADMPQAEAEPEPHDDLSDALALREAQARGVRSRGAAMRARAPTRMASGSVRGALDWDTEGGSGGQAPSETQALTASQRRTLARVESCLPDHIRITRVRESDDGRRVLGVDTSEPLSDEVDECVTGVLDTFPRAQRRRRRASMVTQQAASEASGLDKR